MSPTPSYCEGTTSIAFNNVLTAFDIHGGETFSEQASYIESPTNNSTSFELPSSPGGYYNSIGQTNTEAPSSVRHYHNRCFPEDRESYSGDRGYLSHERRESEACRSTRYNSTYFTPQTGGYYNTFGSFSPNTPWAGTAGYGMPPPYANFSGSYGSYNTTHSAQEGGGSCRLL